MCKNIRESFISMCKNIRYACVKIFENLRVYKCLFKLFFLFRLQFATIQKGSCFFVHQNHTPQTITHPKAAVAGLALIPH